jgi:hypothetical protein
MTTGFETALETKKANECAFRVRLVIAGLTLSVSYITEFDEDTCVWDKPFENAKLFTYKDARALAVTFSNKYQERVDVVYPSDNNPFEIFIGTRK